MVSSWTAAFESCFHNWNLSEGNNIWLSGRQTTCCQNLNIKASKGLSKFKRIPNRKIVKYEKRGMGGTKKPFVSESQHKEYTQSKESDTSRCFGMFHMESRVDWKLEHETAKYLFLAPNWHCSEFPAKRLPQRRARAARVMINTFVHRRTLKSVFLHGRSNNFYLMPFKVHILSLH